MNKLRMHVRFAGIPSYARAAKISPEEATERLFNLAKECGATGVVMDCVDFNNYTPAMRRVLCK